MTNFLRRLYYQEIKIMDNYYLDLPADLIKMTNDFVISSQLEDHKIKFKSTLEFFENEVPRYEEGLMDSDYTAYWDYIMDSWTGEFGFSEDRRYYPRHYSPFTSSVPIGIDYY